MSTTIHAVFNVNSGNVYFLIVIFNIHGRKKPFSESSQNSVSEKKRLLVNLRSFFSTYKFFPGRDGFFLLLHSQKNFLTKR